MTIARVGFRRATFREDTPGFYQRIGNVMPSLFIAFHAFFIITNIFFELMNDGFRILEHFNVPFEMKQEPIFEGGIGYRRVVFQIQSLFDRVSGLVGARGVLRSFGIENDPDLVKFVFGIGVRLFRGLDDVFRVGALMIGEGDFNQTRSEFGPEILKIKS